jgi:hypothetical protein
VSPTSTKTNSPAPTARSSGSSGSLTNSSGVPESF